MRYQSEQCHGHKTSRPVPRSAHALSLKRETLIEEATLPGGFKGTTNAEAEVAGRVCRGDSTFPYSQICQKNGLPVPWRGEEPVPDLGFLNIPGMGRVEVPARLYDQCVEDIVEAQRVELLVLIFV